MIPLDEDKEPSETLNETTDIREREIIKFGQMLKAGKYPRTTQRSLGLLKALLKYYTSGHEQKASSTNNGRTMQAVFRKRLDTIQTYIASCAPLTPGVLNVFDYIKDHIPLDIEIRKGQMLSKICEEVTEAIRDFISSKIIGAIEQICKEGTDLIRDNEVILTYKMNTSIQSLFLKAKSVGK